MPAQKSAEHQNTLRTHLLKKKATCVHVYLTNVQRRRYYGIPS
jgi:hypothetical protein